MTTTPSLRFFNTGEVAIHYAEWAAEDGNAGPAFLFLHGITGRHETWYGVVDEIRQGARAFAVDLRGHGRSGRASGAYKLPDYVRDITALIKVLDTGPVIAVGHSLGAMVVIALAAMKPDLVRAVVLEDAPLFARTLMENHAPERYERFLQSSQLAASRLSLQEMAGHIRSSNPYPLDEEAVQKSALSLFITDADAIMHVHDERIDWSDDIDQMLQSVQCPALLMQGNFELGAWMLEGDGDRAVTLMPGCRLARWDDTGHRLHSARPERFVEQVNGFTSELVGICWR